jgi:hypothetical protein
MKLLKLVGGICYATSFFFAANLFFKFNIGLSIGTTLIIFLILGGLGFLFNLISYTKDKTGNPLSNLIFWLGSFLVFFGLVLKLLGRTNLINLIFFELSISTSLIILGSILLFYSFFFLRNSKTKNKEKEEILDQF